MRVRIEDDFDLEKIANSGQCFRVRRFEDGTYRFVTGSNILYISLTDKKNSSANEYLISCDESAWNNVWIPYFDLGRNYCAIRADIPIEDAYMRKCADCGAGIRILKQDSWEMLVSFIISQRKSIPAIKSSIEAICERFGKSVTTEYEALYLFPTPKELACATEDDLKECKLGYRVSYVMEAAKAVCNSTIDLSNIAELSDEDLFGRIKEHRGVGDKVANCICLFAYGRVGRAPIDTWIQKVIDGIYNGANPFLQYEGVGGIMQQYMFYYAQTHKDEF